MLKLRFVCALPIVGILLSACGSSAAPEPPRLVRFKTVADVEEFIHAAEFTDSEYEAYREEKLKGSSPSTKEDAQKFAKMMESVGYPIYAHPEEIENVSYDYNPDKNILDIIFRIHGVRYRFYYSKFQEYEKYLFDVKVAMCTIDGREYPVYKLTPWPYKIDQWLSTSVYAGGYEIEIAVMDAIEPSNLVLSDFSWSREMEYMEKP